LALGNFVIGLGILAPAGMMADLSTGFDVTIGAVGLLISLGAAGFAFRRRSWRGRRVASIDAALLSAVMLWVAVGRIASALAPGYPSLLGLRLAMLVFAASFTPLAAGAAALLVPNFAAAMSLASKTP
jgi:DHA1 family inner membrane transport protein